MAVTRIILLLFVICAGCAPQLGVRIAPPEVPDIAAQNSDENGAEPIKVRIAKFLDVRVVDTLATVDGREVRADGDLTAVVQEGLQRYLTAAGAKVVLFNAPVVTGELISWHADIQPGFPTSQVQAKSKVKIEVRGIDARVIYHATYSGEASAIHPIMSESRVRDVLGQALGSSLEEIIRDTDFIAALGNGRS